MWWDCWIPATYCELPLFSYHTVSNSFSEIQQKKSPLIFVCRFLKKQKNLKGEHSPPDNSILIPYGLTSTSICVYSSVATIINAQQELHFLPNYEHCMMSEILVNPTKLFFFIILPIFLIFFITLFFDSNIWQRPYSTHVNVQDIYKAIFTQTSIKTSALTFLFIIATMTSILKCVLNLQMSVYAEGLVAHSLLLPLLIVKGPCLAYWTYQTESNNLEEAKRNHMLLEIELYNRPSNVESASPRREENF